MTHWEGRQRGSLSFNEKDCKALEH
jgi:hypothetical protein